MINDYLQYVYIYIYIIPIYNYNICDTCLFFDKSIMIMYMFMTMYNDKSILFIIVKCGTGWGPPSDVNVGLQTMKYSPLTSSLYLP